MIPDVLTVMGRPALVMMPHGVDTRPLAFTVHGDASEAVTGARTIETDSSLPGAVHQLTFVAETRADIRTIEDFFDDRQGAKDGFWVPTWQWEFEIVDHFVSDPHEFWIWITKSHYGLGSFSLGNPFRYMALLHGDTYWVLRALNVAQDNPTGTGWERVRVEQVVDGGLLAAVSPPFTEAKGVRPLWLRYVRLVDDEIETQELGEDSALITISVVELPRETPV
jgi:hypothetical protein